MQQNLHYELLGRCLHWMILVPLNHEKDKIVQMGSLKITKVDALAANEGSKINNKLKQQFKGKKYEDQEECNTKSTQESSNFEKKVVCACCKKPNHEKHACMKKFIDWLTHLLERHNNNILDNVKKKAEKFEKPQDVKCKGKETGHVLVLISSSSSIRVLDLGASNHMASWEAIFTSVEPSTSPIILMGYITLI